MNRYEGIIYRKHPHAMPVLDTIKNDGRVIRRELPPLMGGWSGYDKHYWEDVTDQPNAFNIDQEENQIDEAWENRRVYAS
jgi:hypothetical protein